MNQVKIYCQLKAIDFVKIEGSGINKSRLFDGYVLKTQKTSTSYPSHVSPVRILCINQDLKRLANKIGIQIESRKIEDIHKLIKEEFDFLVAQSFFFIHLTSK